MKGMKGGKVVGQKRVLVVDDHPTMRLGLRYLIETQTDLRVCGEAETAAEAMTQVRQTSPDVALVDLSLKDSHGLDLIKDMQALYPRLPAMVVSVYDERRFGERALLAGARGYVNKQQPQGEIILAIRRVLAGGRYLSPQLAALIAERTIQGTATADDPVASLSDRELQVFKLLGQGRTSAEIAATLHLDGHTVETYRTRLKLKLNCISATQLIHAAVLWAEHHAQPRACRPECPLRTAFNAGLCPTTA